MERSRSTAACTLMAFFAFSLLHTTNGQNVTTTVATPIYITTPEPTTPAVNIGSNYTTQEPVTPTGNIGSNYTTQEPVTPTGNIGSNYTTQGPFTPTVSTCSKEKPCFNRGTCKTTVYSTYCKCVTGFNGDRCQHKYVNTTVCGSSFNGTFRTSNETYNNADPLSFRTCRYKHKCYNGSHEFMYDKNNFYKHIYARGCINSSICSNINQFLNVTFRKSNVTLLSEDIACCDGDFCNVGSQTVTPGNTPCQPNPCKHRTHCISSVGGYTCKCPGYFKGKHCEYVNYCFFEPCKNGGKCVENPSNLNSYKCTDCPHGYMGKRCEKATSFGSNMYAFGIPQGDQEMPADGRYSWLCWRRDIPDVDLYFYGRRHNSLYVCRNGIIQFNSQYRAWWPYKFGVRRWYRQFGIIAPYWSLVDGHIAFSTDHFYYRGFNFPSDPNSMSRVYYHAYSNESAALDSAVLTRASEDIRKYDSKYKDFNAIVVIVVTWVNLYPYRSQAGSPYYSLSNTFQAVIITDGLRAFTLFNYPSQGIQWVVPAEGDDWRRYWYNSYGLPVAGWNSGSGIRNKFVNIEGSGTLDIILLSDLKGNTNVTGRWMFPLNDGPTSKSEAELKCRRWHRLQPTISENPMNENPCPCSLFQAWRDRRFRWDWDYHYNYAPAGVECRLLLRFFRINRLLQATDPKTNDNFNAVWSQRCCYSYQFNDFGSLMEGPRYGGHLHLTNNPRIKGFLTDEEAHRACCAESDRCELFYEKRPSDNCQGYRPPRGRWFWGDPHIVTMDNKNYTFNGLGEYIMVDVNNADFQLQARTAKAPGDEATVFSAAAAKDMDSGTIEVRLNNGSLEILVDGNIFDFSTVSANISKEISNISISREENDAISATFPSGISVTFGEVKGMMTIVFSAPESFKNKTMGLLGKWNDDPDDDFTLPDGSTIPISANDSTIHYEFGLKWQISTAQSLFTYKSGEGVDTFKNESYTPLFADSLTFYNETLERQARETCGSNVACLFDVAATKDVSVGEATLLTSEKLVNESNQLENFPPEVVNTTSKIKLYLNQMATIIVNAQDKNGDSITFTWPSLPGLQATQSGNVLTIKWTKTSTDKVNFTVVLKDSKGASSIWEPTIMLYACQNGGNASNVVDQSGDRFLVMPCTCASGYTGKFCESDIDACEMRGSPCFPGVQCNDLPPPSGVDGYKCGPCPEGYSGDGATCADIDECLSNTKCSQKCINTPGSFRCQCRPGYKLKSDNFTCTDINECLTPVCQHKCNNTDGSYLCYCNDGFQVDANNSKLCVPIEKCNASIAGCDQVCYKEKSVSKCSCNKGYELKDDGKTCKNINECAKSPCSQICVDYPGSYQCKCRPGYELALDKTTCDDINECIGKHNCSDPHHKCINTPGSYRCECESGLEMRNGSCKEKIRVSTTPMPATTATTKPPSPPPPRTPNKQEKEQSAQMLIKSMRTDEWTLNVDKKFKSTVANLATKYCKTKRTECGLPKSQRSRRSISTPLYNASQVHLLPSYPKQNGSDVWVAFYIQNPGSNVITPAIPVLVLAKIVNEGIVAIQISVGNRTIAKVQRVFDQVSTTAKPPPPTAPAPSEKWIIIGVCLGVFVLIVIIIILVLCHRKNNRIKELGESQHRSNVGYMDDDEVELRKIGKK